MDFQNKGLFVALDQPNQVEFNRRKNVEQDQRLSTLSSQVQQLIEQAPAGFLPRVYYGLAEGNDTYRFTEDEELAVELENDAEVGDAFELYSANQTKEYIPAVAILTSSTTIKITIQGDYDTDETTFTLVNMRTGAEDTLTLGSSPLTLQDASYLGGYDAADYKEKQITVLYDLATNKNNTLFASIDINGDGVYNWVSIGGFKNGIDGASIYSVNSTTIATILNAARVGDSILATAAFTYNSTNFNIGDVYIVSTLSPLAISYVGNIRGAQGETGATGADGQDGADGATPTIVDGYWYINGTSTGVVAAGTDGTDGTDGQSFQMQSGLYSTPDNWGETGNTDGDGNNLLQLPTLPQSNISGKGYVVYDPLTTPLSPYYDLYYANNGDVSWTIIHPFSGIAGQDGANGYTPYIQNNQWYINGVSTGVQATGDTGATGATGATPVITGAATVDSNTGTPGVTVVKTGTDAAPTLTFNFTNLKGDTGNTGATGATGNGVASVTKISTSGLVDTYRMTFTNGTYTDFTVTNGAAGSGGVTFTTLWTNSSPLTSFISQTVNLASSDWDYLLVTYMLATVAKRTQSVVYNKANTSSLGFSMPYINTSSQYGVITGIRQGQCVDSTSHPLTSYAQVWFSDAYEGKSTIERVDNDYCLPYSIVGIKLS